MNSTIHDSLKYFSRFYFDTSKQVSKKPHLIPSRFYLNLVVYAKIYLLGTRFIISGVICHVF